MPEHTEQSLFFALSDPTRRKIVEKLSVQPANMQTISAAFGMSRQAVAKHIRTLQFCGMVSLEKEGREQICRFRPESLKELQAWLHKMERFWHDRFDQLEKHLSDN